MLVLVFGIAIITQAVIVQAIAQASPLSDKSNLIECNSIAQIEYLKSKDIAQIKGKLNPKILEKLKLQERFAEQGLSKGKLVKILIYLDPKYISGELKSKNFSEIMREISEQLSNIGIELLDTSGNPIIAALHNRNELESLTLFNYIAYVEDATLPRFKPTIQSEGVNVTHVRDAWNSGFTGAGIKIGVLDLGFTNWETLKDSGELPQNTYLYSPNGVGDGVHGSACAEIIYDVAFGIDGLYLANTGSTTENTLDAVKWFKDNGVRVISHSIVYYGWGPSYFDSDGDDSPEFWDIYRIIDYAIQNNIVWVNAAGNGRDGHWEGYWKDIDDDGILDLYGNGTDNTSIEYDIEGIQVTLQGGREFDTFVRWSDYNYPDYYPTNDFDIYLYCNLSGNWTVVSYSQNPQDNSFGQEPLEVISYTPLGSELYYCDLIIKKYDAPQANSMYFDIWWEGNIDTWYYNNSSYDPVIESGSVVPPADHPDVIAVGAVPYTNTSELEYFSSIGPTINFYLGITNLTKPDVVAPDRVSTESYPDDFTGTSAATPHVTGLVALILSKNRSLSNAEIREILDNASDDLGIPGKDNFFGSGLMNASKAIRAVKGRNAVWYVPDNFTKIQWAVDNATAGDLIVVRDGTYVENIVVDKSLIITSENGSANCIIQAADSDNHVLSLMADNITVRGFTIEGATEDVYAGVFLQRINNTDIVDNTIVNNYYGIRLVGTSYINITNNVVSDNYYGISLYESNCSNVASNIAYSNHIGIYINSDNRTASNNTLTNNTVYNNDNGITINYSSNSILLSNTAYNNSYGITLGFSTNNDLINNTVFNNSYGIHLQRSNYSTLTNNTIDDNYVGLFLEFSGHNTLRNSSLIDNTYSFRIRSDTLDNFIQDIDTTNLINGKPIYYLVDESDRTVSDAGFVGLVNCRNVTVKDLTITNNYEGVLLAYTTNSTVENLTLSYSYYGIYLYNSSHNNVTGNILYNNTGYDIYAANSPENTFYANTFSRTFPTTASIDYSGDFAVRGVESPPDDPLGYKNIGKYLDVTNLSPDTWANVSIYYDEPDVKNEKSLLIWKYNGSWYKEGWNETRFLDTTNNVVGVNITGFGSIFAPLEDSPPVVVINSPHFNEMLNTRKMVVNLTINDTDFHHTNISLVDAVSGQITNSTTTNQTGTFTLILTAPFDGVYNLIVTAHDREGNLNTSEITNITIDTVPPLMSINSPSSNTFLNTSLIEINVTTWDDNFHYAQIQIYNSTNVNSTYSTTTNQTGTYTITLLVPGDGVYNIRAIAYDHAGNTNSAEITNITVDATPPSIVITSPSQGSTLTTKDVTVIWSGTDSIGINHYEIKLDSGNWTEVGKATSYTFTGLSNGNHIIYVKAIDDRGNSNVSFVAFTVSFTYKARTTGSGGGGGGGPPLFTAPFYYAFVISKYLPKPEWYDLAVPENYANLTNLLSFSLKFSKNVYVDVRFSKVIKLPKEIPIPSIDLYQLNEIVIVKFGTRDKIYPEKAYINFRVEKSWLNAKGYDVKDIAMFRWNNESREWEKLKTEYLESDTAYAYYKAYLINFSLFAIGVRIEQPAVNTATPATPQPTATPTPAATSTPSVAPALVTTPTTQTTPTPVSSPTPVKPWIPGFEAIFAIAGVLAVAYLLRR